MRVILGLKSRNAESIFELKIDLMVLLLEHRVVSYVLWDKVSRT